MSPTFTIVLSAPRGAHASLGRPWRHDHGMHVVVRTPDIGEGIAEVELVAWHVKIGDTVRRSGSSGRDDGQGDGGIPSRSSARSSRWVASRQADFGRRGVDPHRGEGAAI